MIANGEMSPIWLKGVILSTHHDPDVVGVVLG